MTNSYYAQKLLISLLVFCGTLSGCQRASYSFQRPESVLEEAGVAPLTFAPPSALVLPARGAIKVIRRHQSHSLTARKPVVCLVERGILVTGTPRLQLARPVAASLHRMLPQHLILADNPTPAASPSKAVAVMLAVLLGVFGAHLFYLGYRKRAFKYLVATLICLGLIVLLLATLPAASLGSGLAILFVASMAAVGIAMVYVYALLDALRIIFNGVDTIG